MAYRKRKQQCPPEPESEILRKARESSNNQPMISQFISIRPNGSAFPSNIVPFKPLVLCKPNELAGNAPVNMSSSNFQQYLSQTNASTSSSPVDIQPPILPSVSQPFKPVFTVNSSNQQQQMSLRTDNVNENKTTLPALGEDNENQLSPMKIECIQCEMSQLQKDLYDAVDYLMLLSEQEQHNLKVQLFNHPCLLYGRVKQLSAPFANKTSGKKARNQWVCYSNVLSKFPTRYDSIQQCQIEESGKLFKLFQILVETSRDDDSQNPAQFIIASSFPRTLTMICELMEQINAKLNYSIYPIGPNMPSTTRQWDLGRAMGDEGRKLILLNTKTENLPDDFFNGVQLIFYDFDKANDGKLLARWNVAGVEGVQRLATLGTFEATE